jgi:hypothetical protein
LNESFTIFDVLVFKVKVDMVAIYQLAITLSALLKLIVLFNFHSLQHFRSFIRHLNHKILSDLSASRQAKKSLFIWTRFLISFHIFREYQLGCRAEIICWLLVYMPFWLAHVEHFRYFWFEFCKIKGKCNEHRLMQM